MKSFSSKKIIIISILAILLIVIFSLLGIQAAKAYNEKLISKKQTSQIKIIEDVQENTNVSLEETAKENIIKLPVYSEEAKEKMKNIYKSDEKIAYLTFDDGPSQAITPQILDILNEYDVKATFFVLGKMANANPDLIRREYEEGHYIANHGYSHTYSKIYESKDSVYEEYMETEKKIQEALGNPDYHTYLFRFPGGSSGGPHEKVKEQARELLRNEGIAFTNWNCLTEDAAGSNTKEQCMNSFIKSKEDQNSLIVLMHDAADKQQTVETLPELIQYLKNEGYEFKTFYDIYK